MPNPSPPADLLVGRRFKPRMVRALKLVAAGHSFRDAAEATGHASHQDVARAARELGVGVRRVKRRNGEAA